MSVYRIKDNDRLDYLSIELNKYIKSELYLKTVVNASSQITLKPHA